MPARHSTLRRRLVLLVLLAPFVAAAAPRGDLATPRAAAEALYADHFAHDMAFTRSSVARKKRWLTPELYRLIQAYLRRPGTPNEAPPINGDPFTNTQEHPSGFAVGDVSASAAEATVVVAMKLEPQRRIVRLQMRRTAGLWRVDDLVYEDGSTLRGLLRAAR